MPGDSCVELSPDDVELREQCEQGSYKMNQATPGCRQSRTGQTRALVQRGETESSWARREYKSEIKRNTREGHKRQIGHGTLIT